MVKHKVHKSLLRIVTFLGCDRKCSMLLIVLCLTLIIFGGSLAVSLLSSLMYLLCMMLLKRMASYDLLFLKVLKTNFRYRTLYQAHSPYGLTRYLKNYRK